MTWLGFSGVGGRVRAAEVVNGVVVDRVPLSGAIALVIAACLLGTAGTGHAQTRSGWQQHDGPPQNAKVNSKTTREMFAAVDVPRRDEPGWFAAKATNGYFVNKASNVPCNVKVDYTYFQTFFTLEAGRALEALELQFASADFDDGGMVIVNGDLANAIFVDKGTRTSLNLAGQIKPGENRIVVAQADNCKVLNKVPAMELSYRLRGASAPAIAATVGAGPSAGAQPAPQQQSQPQPLSPRIARLVVASNSAEENRRAAVAFVSTDGSAELGSRTVFTLVNTATGDSVVVPVDGRRAQTRMVVFVEPGTYRVQPPPPSIGVATSFTTSKVSATQITAGASGANAPSASVTFSLEAKRAPVALVAKKITSSSVELQWGALRNTTLASYQLVRTDGRVPAASPNAGTPVALASPTATTATATGLAPGREYTFAVFPTNAAGQVLPAGANTITTAQAGGDQEAFALAPNTIVPASFASLNATALGNSRVRVTLDPANMPRASGNAIPGVDSSALNGSGCVVGTPFYLSPKVAGNNTFFGKIDVCEAPTSGPPTAIVNGDVPMSAVFSYYFINAKPVPQCFDGNTGEKLPAAQCGRAPTPVQTAANTSANPTGSAAGPQPLQIQKGTDLVRGQKYFTGSGQFYLSFQTDGNLVVKRANGDYIWGLDRQSKVDYRKIGRVTWQRDGNLAAYSSDGQYQWSAFTANPDPNSNLAIDDQGVLQIVNGARVLWRASLPRVGSLDRGEPSPFAGLTGHGMRPEDSQRSDGTARPGDWTSTPIWPTGTDDGMFAFAPLPKDDEFTLMYATGAVLSKRIECKKGDSSRVTFNVGPQFQDAVRPNYELSVGKFTWDVQVGVWAYFSPQIIVEGAVECSLKLPSINIQLSTGAVPVHLEIRPVVDATMTGKVNLSGPTASLTLGAESRGRVEVVVEWCSWVPCGADVQKDFNAGPVVEFKQSPPKLEMEGSLNFKAGAEAILGIGIKNDFVTQKAGFGLTIAPLSTEIKGSAGTSGTCFRASVGFSAKLDIVAETYILAWGGEQRFTLYDAGHRPYPGAEFKTQGCT